MTKIEIKFGILIKRGICNKANMEWYRKIDTFNYIQKISDNYEDIDNEIEIFKREAKEISSKDSEVAGYTGKTEYFLVCYIENGNDITIKKIKDLFY